EWRLTGFASAYPINNTPHSGGVDPDPNQDLPIPSVSWSEGVVFAALTTTNGGRVIAIDPREGLSAFRPGPAGATGQTADLTAVPDLPGMPPVISTPTVGYVRDN